MSLKFNNRKFNIGIFLLIIGIFVYSYVSYKKSISVREHKVYNKLYQFANINLNSINLHEIVKDVEWDKVCYISPEMSSKVLYSEHTVYNRNEYKWSNRGFLNKKYYRLVFIRDNNIIDIVRLQPNKTNMISKVNTCYNKPNAMIKLTKSKMYNNSYGVDIEAL